MANNEGLSKNEAFAALQALKEDEINNDTLSFLLQTVSRTHIEKVVIELVHNDLIPLTDSQKIHIIKNHIAFYDSQLWLLKCGSQTEVKALLHSPVFMPNLISLSYLRLNPNYKSVRVEIFKSKNIHVATKMKFLEKFIPKRQVTLEILVAFLNTNDIPAVRDKIMPLLRELTNVDDEVPDEWVQRAFV